MNANKKTIPPHLPPPSGEPQGASSLFTYHSVLYLNDITIGYHDKTVATALTAHLPQGTLTCLTGRNGTGKSTLMRTIAAFMPPLHGTITLRPQGDGGAERDISRLTAAERARLVGIVLTGRTAPHNMTVREMVAMGRAPYTGFWGRLSREHNTIIDEALRMVDMEPLAQRHVSTLSDGERQKVMIAKTLAQQTPLILLDEPTAFLDYPSKASTLTMLRRLCHEQGKTVLLSTHDLDVALRLTDNVWHLADGRLTTGTPDTMPDLTAITL